MRKTKFTAAVAALAAGVLALGLAGCGDKSTESRSDNLKKSQASFDGRKPPKVTGDAEYQNYMRAQEEVYDDPSSIIWCTVYPENPAAPIFTVPVAGKLTSSSTSFYPGQSVKNYGVDGAYVPTENQSVDGMYHGSPPPYRYGFTPGGQYVDFFNLPTFCTTQLTAFQRQTLKVAQVDGADKVTKQAEAKLKEGKPAEAQALLDGVGK